MLYAIFLDQQPQNLEEIQSTLQRLGQRPFAYAVEIYPTDDGQKDRSQFHGWIGLIWSGDGESITTCAIPEHDLLIDAPRGTGIKEIKFAPSIGSE